MDDEARHCLVISDGRRGIETQVLGLAEACASLRPMSVQTRHIQHGKMLSALPPKAQLRFAKYDFPHCDIAIGCGRQAIAPLLFLKRHRFDVMTVYVQDPRLNPSEFDLVIAPSHDAITGDNVETMIGSTNRVTHEKIISETSKFAASLSLFPTPRTALLIGGTSKTRKLDRVSHASHMKAAQLLLDAGQSLLITTSRRTPDFAVHEWKRFASNHKTVWLHDEEGPNPYFAFLGGADMILVTEDSTNMLTEACATGKPVFRLPMSGGPGKFEVLYEALERLCHVTSYVGQLSGDTYEPLTETARIAQRLWERYDSRFLA